MAEEAKKGPGESPELSEATAGLVAQLMLFLKDFNPTEKLLIFLWRFLYAVEKLLGQPEFFRVAVYGTGQKIAEDHPVYKAAWWLGFELARLGFDIVAGGGSGVMKAVAEGFKAGQAKFATSARCIGVCIEFVEGQTANPFIDKSFWHGSFWTRLHHFCRLSYVHIVLEGGVGSLLELLSAWQPKTRPITVGHVLDSSIIVVGDLYDLFFDGIVREQINRGYIRQDEVDMITRVKTVEAALPHVVKAFERFTAMKAAG